MYVPPDTPDRHAPSAVLDNILSTYRFRCHNTQKRNIFFNNFVNAHTQSKFLIYKIQSLVRIHSQFWIHPWPTKELKCDMFSPLASIFTFSICKFNGVYVSAINFKYISSSSSSCSWRVRCVSCSLILKMKLVPPSLPRSSYVPSSFWFIL